MEVKEDKQWKQIWIQMHKIHFSKKRDNVESVDLPCFIIISIYSDEKKEWTET